MVTMELTIQIMWVYKLDVLDVIEAHLQQIMELLSVNSVRKVMSAQVELLAPLQLTLLQISVTSARLAITVPPVALKKLPVL